MDKNDVIYVSYKMNKIYITNKIIILSFERNHKMFKITKFLCIIDLIFLGIRETTIKYYSKITSDFANDVRVEAT